MHLTNSPLQRYAALACVAAVAINDAFAAGSVVEFYNPDLDNFFITADPAEQANVDTGAVGRWQPCGHLCPLRMARVIAP